MRTILHPVVILLSLFFLNTPLHAQDDLNAYERVVIKKITRINNWINELVKDDKGRSISKHKTPQDVMYLVEEMEKILQKLPENSPLKTDLLVGRVYMSAFTVLLYGRGEEVEGDGIYWFLNNKNGESGLNELTDLLARSPFDEQMKRILSQKLRDIEPGNFQIRGSIDTDVDFITEDIRNTLIRLLDMSESRESYTNYFQSVDFKKFEKDVQLNKLSKNTSKIKLEHKSFKQLIAMAGLEEENIEPVQKNYYSESVDLYNDKSKEFPEYFGREKEVQKILDTFSKSQKSHILLHGKQGVDRNVILKMLSDGFVNGKYKIAEEDAPIIVEMPIIYLISQPVNIKTLITNFSIMSRRTNRRIIVYLDEVQASNDLVKQSIKSFLSQTTMMNDLSKVHFIWGTTSEESRMVLSDASFESKWTEVFLKEFNKEESIELIKKEFIPRWTAHYKIGPIQFKDFDEGALEFVARNYKVEDPNTVRSEAMREMLEGAIARKKRVLQENKTWGNFSISVNDIRDYLKEKFDQDLIPGDKRFNDSFNERWAKFETSYFGNEGYKSELKEALFLHFSDPERSKISAWIKFGPPGGGKSYGAKEVAKNFFNGALLTLNGADYKDVQAINKLAGSAPGYVGSEQQRSPITKFLKENPSGGIILFEEVDYIHPDVMEFLTNTITSKKFRDGLGKEWDLGKYVLWFNSNIGQEYMIPTDSKNKMNWSQYEVRLNQLTQLKTVDGKEVRIVRADKKSEMMDKLMAAIINNGRIVGTQNNEVDEKVSQAAQKQKRRYKQFYVMGPSREDLKKAAIFQFMNYKTKLELDYNIVINVSDETLERIIDVDNMEFEKGYSYVEERLDTFLFNKLNFHKAEQGAKIDVELVQKIAASPVDNQNTLVLKIDGQEKVYDLGNMLPAYDNQWAKSAEIKENIKKFPSRVSQYLKGDEELIVQMQSIFKRHAIDWKSRPVISVIGTTGNGKSQLAKATAQAIFGSNDAYKLIPTTSVNEFDHFINGQEFKNWIESRIRSGGGVLLIDELLSVQNNPEMKLYMFNKLYQLLDEGYMTIDGKSYDLRGFIPVLTGNAMQEVFSGIPSNPDGERLTQEIIKDLTEKDIIDYFNKFGFDPPKIARMGLLNVKGPLTKAVSYQVGHYLLEDSLKSILEDSGIYVNVKVDPKIIEQSVDAFSTILLGMRDVKKNAIDKLILNPIGEILTDLPNVETLEMKMSDRGLIEWYANDKRIVLESVKVSETLEERNWNFLKEANNTKDSTLQLKDVAPAKPLFDPQTRQVVRVHEINGHWMAGYLLTGKNSSSSINMIPADHYLGYVMDKSEKIFKMDTFSTILKRIIVLEAGHRAVFKEGLYAGGGGTGQTQRDPKVNPTDDLGRVEKILDKVLSNNLMEDFVEFDSPDERAFFKKMIRGISKGATDYVIDYGNENKVADAIHDAFNKKVEAGLDEFLNEAEIEAIVENNLKTKNLKNPSQLLYEALVKGSIEYMNKPYFLDKNTEMKLYLIKTVLDNLASELINIDKDASLQKVISFENSKFDKKYKEIQNKIIERNKLQNPGADCNSFF